MNKNNKKSLKWIGSISIVLIIITIFIRFSDNKPKESINSKIDKVETSISNEQEKSIKNTIDFVSSMYGLEVNYLKVINDPVGLRGKLITPNKTVTSGLNYIMDNIIKNDKLDDIKISLNEGSAIINVIYKVTDKIKTPVEMTIIPKLTNDNSLQIEIKEVKFSDIKIFKWIVDFSTSKFIKEWIPKDSKFKIEYKDGNVVIDKNNFKGVTFNDITITSKSLDFDITFDLEKIMKNIAGKYKK